MKTLLIITAFLFIGLPASLSATDSVDFIVIVDQSGSIRANLPVVKEYVLKSIYGTIAQEDDIVYLFSFDDKLYSHGAITKTKDTKIIEEALATVNAKGMFTDLTNAVELMTLYMQKNSDPNRRKIVFFLTDGKNDPPVESPYKEGLNHRFFKEAKRVVDEKQWKVFVTGIGEKTDAPEVANLVGADYVELSATPSLSEFDQKLTSKLKIARGGYWIYIGIGFGIVTLLGGGFFALKWFRII